MRPLNFGRSSRCEPPAMLHSSSGDWYLVGRKLSSLTMCYHAPISIWFGLEALGGSSVDARLCFGATLLGQLPRVFTLRFEDIYTTPPPTSCHFFEDPEI